MDNKESLKRLIDEGNVQEKTMTRLKEKNRVDQELKKRQKCLDQVLGVKTPDIAAAQVVQDML